jgi:hypothetical protein
LDVIAVNGDVVNLAVTLQTNITGYSFESYIYQSATTTAGGGAGSLSGIGATVTQPTIGISNATTGAMIIGLSENQTRILSPGKTYRWYLRWISPTDITRTILSGSITAVAP